MPPAPPHPTSQARAIPIPGGNRHYLSLDARKSMGATGTQEQVGNEEKGTSSLRILQWQGFRAWQKYPAPHKRNCISIISRFTDDAGIARTPPSCITSQHVRSALARLRTQQTRSPLCVVAQKKLRPPMAQSMPVSLVAG